MIPESGDTLELGGPGGAGYNRIMDRKPKAAMPLSPGVKLAAAGAGMGQALMGSKMGKAFNAGAGGYHDLYKAKAYPEALHHLITGPSPDDPINVTNSLLQEADKRRSPGTRGL